MMIVRGSGIHEDDTEIVEIIQDETFNLCDYYQVSGNYKRFTVYTLAKKKGKPTGEITTLAYSYDENDGKIMFSSDESRNQALLSCNLKLKSVILFSAGISGITQDQLFKLDGVNIKYDISPFNLLKVIATIYDQHKADTDK